MKGFSVAIDGPSGAGKSTMAKQVAAQLGLHYVDTGAIYRTLGYYVCQHGVAPEAREEIEALLPQVQIKLDFQADGVQHMILNGTDVTDRIRTPEIAKYASAVAAVPAVRAFLLEMQRALAREDSVIMDGRDIGTVVLPDANVKIYLTASAQERARRRVAELREKDPNVSYETVLEDMRRRDEADMNRAIAPLRKAEDATELDTSALTISQSVEAIVALIRERMQG